MQKTDLLIRTKLHLPFTRPGLVPRPWLQEQIKHGLCGPLTLITAPAGFGKTTLVATCVADRGIPIAWLSLDKDDNQAERFHTYLVAALQKADHSIGIETAQLLAASPQPPFEAVLTRLINDLDSAGEEIVLVLDDYQFISSQAVHESVAFILNHCPKTFHLLIATRSDPPLPLARLRARGQTVELRAADLRFTASEAAQFLNDIMGLQLDAESVAALEERTEGWVAGLQMAALSMRGREDVKGYIEGFSGTHRYILDYLLEEVLNSQPAEVQRFLLCTSFLERLNAALCEAVLAKDEEVKGADEAQPGGSRSQAGRSASILEYLERANLFLVPLDDERTWFRYHHLFADLLRAQLQKSPEDKPKLLVRASEWHEQNGLLLEAINYAIMASDGERVEHLIVQNYMQLLGRGEMSWMRFWTGKLSKELVYQRPVLCIYLAQSHAWFGELDEADLLLDEAEKRIRSEMTASDTHPMLGHLAYVRSRVTAMHGDYRQAIELCLLALDNTPISDLATQIGIKVALGYEYFLNGDFSNAIKILLETVKLGHSAEDMNPSVAAYCVLARLHIIQGLLSKAYDIFPTAARLIPEASGLPRGAKALVEVGIAEILCEWNDLEAALVHIQQGLAQMPLWGKADDLALAYTTLARIHLAQTKQIEATEAVEKASQLIQKRGVFPEARCKVDTTQVKLWLAQGDLLAAGRWAASQEERLRLEDPPKFENELYRITQARVLIAQNEFKKANELLSSLEESARSAGRMGRVIEILLLEACALREMDPKHAMRALTECLTLAEPANYVRVFLDEGQPVRLLLTQWLANAGPGPVRDYAMRLLSQFKAGLYETAATPGKVSSNSNQLEALTKRELDVLRFLAAGLSNGQIAEKLFLSLGTVKFYVHAVMQKLGVHSRTQAILIAKERNLL